MEENEIVTTKEKANKKTALMILMVLCITCFTIGAIGGGYKFYLFMLSLDPENQVSETTQENQFKKDGVLNFQGSGGNIIGSYTCQHKNRGWAEAATDDKEYELKTPVLKNDGKYQLEGAIDNRYAILEDSEDKGNPNIIIYNIGNKKADAELSAIKNYNDQTGRLYYVKNKEGKWGVISLAEGYVQQIINYKYDYIGVVIQENQSLIEQNTFAGKMGDSWYILFSELNKDIISVEFKEPIIMYCHKYVVTKDTSDPNTIKYNLYKLNGEKVDSDITNVVLPGYNYLLAYSSNKVAIYDSGNAEELFKKEYPSISTESVSYEVKNSKFVLKVSGNAETELEASAKAIKIEDKRFLTEVPAS